MRPEERKKLKLCSTDVPAPNQITPSSSQLWSRTARMLIEGWMGQRMQIRLSKAATSWNLVTLWGLKMKGSLTSQWRGRAGCGVDERFGPRACVHCLVSDFSVWHMQLNITSVTQTVTFPKLQGIAAASLVLPGYVFHFSEEMWGWREGSWPELCSPTLAAEGF